jgi:hypothetical protein
MKRVGDYTVKVHREPDPVTGQAKAVGSRITGPLGSFRVSHWPSRIAAVQESGENILVVVDQQSRPYLTSASDRLSEAAVSTAETYDTLAGEGSLTEHQAGQIRALVHNYEGPQVRAVDSYVEAGLTGELAHRLAGWVAGQHAAMGKWRGPSSGQGQRDALLEAALSQRALGRLTGGIPQLPAGMLEVLTDGSSGFPELYESDRARSCEALADTEVQLRETAKRNGDCSQLLERWLALHGDGKPLHESDPKLVSIVTERVVRGSGPLKPRSTLDRRVLEAQQRGIVVEPTQVARPESGGTIAFSGSTAAGASSLAEAAHVPAQFFDGTRNAQIEETEVRINEAEFARCGHKIRRGRRTCPHCGESYVEGNPWQDPADVIKALGTAGPWSATISRAKRDLGYEAQGTPGARAEVALLAEGQPTITVIFGDDGKTVAEARLVEGDLVEARRRRGRAAKVGDKVRYTHPSHGELKGKISAVDAKSGVIKVKPTHYIDNGEEVPVGKIIGHFTHKILPYHGEPNMSPTGVYLAEAATFDDAGHLVEAGHAGHSGASAGRFGGMPGGPGGHHGTAGVDVESPGIWRGKAPRAPEGLKRGVRGRSCGVCEHFAGAMCTLYHFPVSSGELCSKFEPRKVEREAAFAEAELVERGRGGGDKIVLGKSPKRVGMSQTVHVFHQHKGEMRHLGNVESESPGRYVAMAKGTKVTGTKSDFVGGKTHSSRSSAVSALIKHHGLPSSLAASAKFSDSAPQPSSIWEAAFAEAAKKRHKHDSCPFCHKGLTGDEKKCPGCGESLTLKGADAKVNVELDKRAHHERFKGREAGTLDRHRARAHGALAEAAVADVLTEARSHGGRGPTGWRPGDDVDTRALSDSQLERSWKHHVGRAMHHKMAAASAPHEDLRRAHTEAHRHHRKRAARAHIEYGARHGRGLEVATGMGGELFSEAEFARFEEAHHRRFDEAIDKLRDEVKMHHRLAKASHARGDHENARRHEKERDRKHRIYSDLTARGIHLEGDFEETSRHAR